MKLAADIKTHFSVGEALLTPEEGAELCAQAGYEAAAIVDTMTISAMPDFTKACDKNGIKPIIGVRLKIVPTLEQEKKQPTCYPVLYILSSEGFKVVTKLLSLANDEEHFYYVPRLTWDDVINALEGAEGHVAFATGALYSALRDPDIGAVLARVANALGRAHTYISVTPCHSAVWDRQAVEGYEWAAKYNLPILLKRPMIFAESDQWDRLGTMGAIATNKKHTGSFSAWVKDYHPEPAGTLMGDAVKQFKRLQSLYGMTAGGDLLKAATGNWATLCDAVTFKWSKLDVSLPRMAEDENEALKKAAVEGLRMRFETGTFGNKQATSAKDYAERLKYELGVVMEMGFANYFLLVREITSYCKEVGIMVGPGRGSVGGSLLSYVLGITDVDPLRFDLIFERFLNPERIDLPDIDLDFMSTRRHEVLEELVRRYGQDHVANISNYTSLQSRAAIQDVARILDLPMQYRGVSKTIPEEQGTAVPLERAIEEIQEVKDFAKDNPRAWELACALEGRMRSLSKHAAGVVVAGEPLINRAVVERRSGEPTVNWDKRVVEDMGLIKIDILGLSTLDLIQYALNKIRARGREVPDLTNIPLDDATVLENFGKGKTVGVFQFESGGMQKLLKSMAQLDPLTFDDLAAATALYRPGPMESGLMDEYVQIKQGSMRPHYDHPSMRPALEETMGVMVYQEQVMRVSRDLAGFTGPEADHLRKAIGKKDREKMATMGDQFIQGAVKAGMIENDAKELWDKIVLFAGYSFNKSHSVEYSLISYQTMWLKTYFPLEFYAAAMTIAKSDKMPSLLRDAQKSGIIVAPPDVNVSTAEFEIADEGTLVAPLSALKGLSEKGTNLIIEERKKGPYKSIEDFTARLPARNVNKTVRGNLELVGAFANIDKESPAATDIRRREDQLVLMPDVMLGGTVVTRDIPKDKSTKELLLGVLNDPEIRSKPAFEGKPFVAPRMGRAPKFMAVFDGPTASDLKSKKGQFTSGNAFETLAEILEAHGLSVQDGYWTGLNKVPKEGDEKFYTGAQIAANSLILKKEMILLKPQVILTLGTAAMRFFDPKIKGGCQDNAGKISYVKETEPGAGNDYNLVIGITPGMLYFDPSRAELLEAAVGTVAEMVL